MSKNWQLRIGIFIILILSVLGSCWWWWKEAITAADSEDANSKIFVVSSGDGIRSIATRLKSEGIVKDQIGFFLLVKLMGKDDSLQAGDFRLSPSMDAEEIIQELTHGTLDVWVTTLEGWRTEETALKLAQQFLYCQLSQYWYSLFLK